ncbi:hypothetical protein MUA27_00510 [Mammaliicoccus sciuri]|uniref:hypothetical protein n=1 Tax=Mammaliicoccus sciuri TaxID=1296 RepID=UPI000BBEAEC9|nr:hypothetical protein [Mammaliicoccus sciuri]PCM41102.1 hypothetical protein CPU09_06880 [Mammaliicoccus sciuri]UXU78148.1 hypothetical protein MUA27_00510 [Mammaliicoccus sciuri]
MKKLLSICLGVIILLAACGSDSKSDEKSKESNASNSQHEKKNNTESNSKVSSIDEEYEKEKQENANELDSSSEDDEDKDEDLYKYEYDQNYVVSKKEEEQLKKLLYKSTNAYGKITDIDHIWQYGEEDRHYPTFVIDGQSIMFDGHNKDLFEDESSEGYQIKKIDDQSIEAIIAKTPKSQLHEVSDPVLKNSKIIITYIDDNTIKIKKDDYPEETLHASINNYEE